MTAQNQAAPCALALSLGMLALGIIGSICLGTNDYKICTGSEGGAITMTVIGFIFFICFSLIFCMVCHEDIQRKKLKDKLEGRIEQI